MVNEYKTLSKQLVSGYHIADVYDASTEFFAPKQSATFARGGLEKLDVLLLDLGDVEKQQVKSGTAA